MVYTITSTSAVWGHWTNAVGTSCGYYDPWPTWTSQLNATSATITGTNTTDLAWHYWARQQPAQQYRAVVSESAEQRRVREQREAEYRARCDADRAARALAERKAETLLLRHLSPVQREEYQRTGAFTVRMDDGRSYRIRKGWAGNVDAFEAPKIDQVLEREGGIVVPAANGAPRRVERLCIHPRELVPDCDNMLAQKLLLEADEAEFRRIANITRVG